MIIDLTKATRQLRKLNIKYVVVGMVLILLIGTVVVGYIEVSQRVVEGANFAFTENIIEGAKFSFK